MIGREFALETLKAVAKIDEEAFVNALKQAVQLSVLEERSQLGVSTLPLYARLLPPDALRGDDCPAAPEAAPAGGASSRGAVRQSRLDEHAAELAEHFSHSTDAADLTKAVKYGEMAAERALDVYAYGEAVRLLDQASRYRRCWTRMIKPSSAICCWTLC